MVIRSSAVIAAVLGCAFTSSAQSNPVTVKSPDGRLVASFETIDNDQPAASGKLVYSVTFRGKPLIERSALSLQLQGQRPLGPEMQIASAMPGTADETYQLVTGKASTVRDHYNSVRLDLTEREPGVRKLAIEARAYDDAIAFRYVVPDQSTFREFRLSSEDTEFRISKDPVTYALVLPHYRTMYEAEYIKLNGSAFAGPNGLSAGKVLIGLPYLMQVPGVGWMAITEANLRDYSSMYLMNASKSWGGADFTCHLAPGDDPDV